MRRAGLIGCALFALYGVMASVALAEEGFLPRTNGKFTIEGGLSTYNTSANLPIICSLLDLVKGALTSDKHTTVALHWLKCTVAGIPVNSENDKGQSETILIEVLLLVCLKPENSEGKALGEFGIAIEVNKAPITLEVPSFGETIKVKGTLIGVVTAKNEEKLSEFKVALAGQNGKQEVAKCKAGEETKVQSLLSESSIIKVDETASDNIEGGKVVFEEKQALMDS